MTTHEITITTVPITQSCAVYTENMSQTSTEGGNGVRFINVEIRTDGVDCSEAEDKYFYRAITYFQTKICGHPDFETVGAVLGATELGVNLNRVPPQAGKWWALQWEWDAYTEYHVTNNSGVIDREGKIVAEGVAELLDAELPKLVKLLNAYASLDAAPDMYHVVEKLSKV